MKDKYIAERLGLCWHNWDWNETSQTYRCTKCRAYLMVTPIPTNPDFSRPAGTVQLLELMMGREDWRDFIRKVWDDVILINSKVIPLYVIPLAYITAPGKLRDAVYEFLKGRE